MSRDFLICGCLERRWLRVCKFKDKKTLKNCSRMFWGAKKGTRCPLHYKVANGGGRCKPLSFNTKRAFNHSRRKRLKRSASGW